MIFKVGIAPLQTSKYCKSIQAHNFWKLKPCGFVLKSITTVDIHNNQFCLTVNYIPVIHDRISLELNWFHKSVIPKKLNKNSFIQVLFGILLHKMIDDLKIFDSGVPRPIYSTSHRRWERLREKIALAQVEQTNMWLQKYQLKRETMKIVDIYSLTLNFGI